MRVIKKIFGWVIPITVAVGAVLFIRTAIAEPMKVAGPSMSPNLINSERMVVFKCIVPKRGSVITFNAKGVDPDAYKNTVYVKRVIGLPGDTVESKNGTIYVNGKAINQSYISKDQRTKGTGNWTMPKLARKNVWLKYQNTDKVPENYYFVLGDNRSVSKDSRYFGFVPKQNVIGVAKVSILAGKNRDRRRLVNSEWKNFWAEEK